MWVQKAWDRLVANVKGEGGGGIQVGAYRTMVVGSLQPREGRNTASREGASSDCMGRRNGSDEDGDGKADADVEVIVGSGQRCGKARGKMGR